MTTREMVLVASVSDIDAETFYIHQRSIGTAWGVELPAWDDLSWADKLEWETKLNEQEARDRDHD
jgi:hypothetical protein